MKQVLDGAKQRGLKCFVIYVNLDLKDGKLVYDPRLQEIIALCKGTDTMIWPYMTSKQFKNSDPAGDDIAVTGLRELADLCAANGLRIAIYPHVNMWVHRVEDAVRVVKKVNRKNVGLTFNLCHALLDGAEARIPALDRGSRTLSVRCHHQRSRQRRVEDGRNRSHHSDTRQRHLRCGRRVEEVEGRRLQRPDWPAVLQHQRRPQGVAARLDGCLAENLGRVGSKQEPGTGGEGGSREGARGGSGRRRTRRHRSGELSRRRMRPCNTDRIFPVSNLFEGDSTLIATAVDGDGLVGLSAPVRVKVKPTALQPEPQEQK